MRIEEIMTTGVKTTRPDAAAADARSAMKLHQIHHLVVLEGRDVVGVVSERDLGGRRGRAPEVRVADVMAPTPVTATPRTTVRAAANLLRGRSIGCLPVVDGKKLVGIVTTTDLLSLIGRGAERPVAESRRWTLKQRGNRRKHSANY